MMEIGCQPKLIGSLLMLSKAFMGGLDGNVLFRLWGRVYGRCLGSALRVPSKS